MRPEAARAVGPVERPEDLGVRQSQRVRPSVRRGDERDPAEPRRHGEGGEVGRAHAREVRVDDQADAVDVLQRGGDRSALALAGVVDRRRTELAGDEAAGGVPRYDPHLADGGRRLDDVAEHRQGDLAAELLGKPALTFLPERDHDEHRRRE